MSYATTNQEIIDKMKQTNNVVAKSSYLQILKSRAGRGDKEALVIIEEIDNASVN